MMTTSSAAADKDNEQAHVQDVRARYEALLPKYGNLWRSMAPKITPQNRQPLSLLPAIENGQAISLRVPSNQCDCPFDSCQDCVEPIVEIDNDGGRDGSSESSEDSGSSQDSAPICFDLSNLRIEDSDGTDNRNKGENRSKKSELIMSPEPEPFRDAASADESLAIKSSQDESLCSSSSSSTNISNGTEQVGWDLSFLRIEDDNESLSGKNAVKKTIDDDIESDADSFANERRWLADRAKEEKESQSQTISLLDDSDSDMESYDKKLPAANNKTERKMEKRQRVVFASDESSSEEEWDEGKELNVKNEPRDEPKRELNRSPTVIVLSDSDDDDGNDSWHDANDVLDDDDESLDESIKEKFAKRVPKAKDTSLSSYAIPTKKNKSKGLSKTAFRKNRQEIADRAFAEFDRVAFGGALLDVELVWSNKLRTTAGITRLKQISGGGKPTKRIATIELSTKIIDEEHRLRATLLHELCHAAAWLVDGVSKPPHGKCFKKWANIAMKKVPDVVVTTTHDYEISFKYAWACTAPKCGVVIQRHSRSVDVTRHCCGKCKSKLIEIEVPSQKGANVQHTPRKKAPLSGYNLFVKENSRVVRERLAREWASHGEKVTQPEVMKECARLWREKNQDMKSDN